MIFFFSIILSHIVLKRKYESIRGIRVKLAMAHRARWQVSFWPGPRPCNSHRNLWRRAVNACACAHIIQFLIYSRKPAGRCILYTSIHCYMYNGSCAICIFACARVVSWCLRWCWRSWEWNGRKNNNNRMRSSRDIVDDEAKFPRSFARGHRTLWRRANKNFWICDRAQRVINFLIFIREKYMRVIRIMVAMACSSSSCSNKWKVGKLKEKTSFFFIW